MVGHVPILSWLRADCAKNAHKRRQNTVIRRSVGAQRKSECLPRTVFLHICTSLTTLVVGFDFEKEVSDVIQKQCNFIPCLHREWLPCVSVVLSSGTRPREKCVCVCVCLNLRTWPLNVKSYLPVTQSVWRRLYTHSAQYCTWYDIHRAQKSQNNNNTHFPDSFCAILWT